VTIRFSIVEVILVFSLTRYKCAVLAALLLVSCNRSASQDPAQMASIERGRVFVEMNCSRCHAIGLKGSSPYAPAPPFRILHERYDVAGLAEAFAEGIVVAHDGQQQMPQFMLEPDQIDDLIAYLKSLES
jgi:cytochrome c